MADPKVEYVYSMLFMAAGAALYLPFVTYKMKLPYVGEDKTMAAVFLKVFLIQLS